MQFPMLDDAGILRHNNFEFRGKTLYWSGSDSLERYQTNCQNNTKKELLGNLGFSDRSITYKYNTYGFRDEEFDHRPCGLAFGCSHTEGVGLPNEAVWPRVLSELTRTWVWNFGAGGCNNRL